METILWVSIGVITLFLLSGRRSRALTLFLRVWTFALLCIVTLSLVYEKLYFDLFLKPDSAIAVRVLKELNVPSEKVVNVQVLGMEEDVETPMTYRVTVRYEIEEQAGCTGDILLTYQNRTWYGRHGGAHDCRALLQL